MVALSTATELDAITVYIVEKALPWLYEKCYQRANVSSGGWTHRMTNEQQRLLRKSKKATDPPIAYLNTKTIAIVARLTIVVLATAIPSLAVLALYLIPTLDWRLGAIAGFSFFISLSMALFTTARPIEIFAATAA